MENKPTKKCPYCGKEILSVAKKCKHCGKWLNVDETANTSNTQNSYQPRQQPGTVKQNQNGIETKSSSKRQKLLIPLLILLCLAALIFSPVSPWGGNVHSQLWLANYYQSHNSPDKALEWFKKAANKGNAQAEYYMGYSYHNNVYRDDKEALKWYEKSALKGNAEAQICMAGCYLNGFGLETANASDMAEAASQMSDRKDIAKKWLKKAAEQNHPQAQYMMGQMCYWAGDLDSANVWFEKAAKKGINEAKKLVALKYEPDIELEKSIHYKGGGFVTMHDIMEDRVMWKAKPLVDSISILMINDIEQTNTNKGDDDIVTNENISNSRYYSLFRLLLTNLNGNLEGDDYLVKKYISYLLNVNRYKMAMPSKCENYIAEYMQVYHP